MVLQRRPEIPLKRSTAEAVAAVVAGAIILALPALATDVIGVRPGWFLAGAYGLYVPSSFLIIRYVGTCHPYDHFGLPNGVTLARLVLCGIVGGIACDLDGRPMADPMAWSVLAIAALALALDGLDGGLARVRNLASPFGARFDMEVDALLILLLSLLVWMQDKAGPWVLLIGGVRYAFVAAGWLWPILARPLPPSFRRKSICVLQGLFLAVLLVPVVASPTSDAIAAVALLLILYSFAVDVMWLIGHRHEA